MSNKEAQVATGNIVDKATPVTTPKVDLPYGVEVVVLPEKIRRSQIRIPRVLDPGLKTIVDGLDPTKNEGLKLLGDATQEQIEMFLQRCLSRTEGKQVSNHELFMFFMVTQFELEELGGVKDDKGNVVNGLSTKSLYARFFRMDKDNKRTFNCFGYPYSWKAFGNFPQEERDKYPFHLHIYQVWMGVWEKNHNQRTWLRFLDSVQAVTRPNGDKTPKFYLIHSWGSNAFLSVLGKTFKEKQTYRQAMVEKAKQLGMIA